MAGSGTTPAAAIPSCASGSSWPTSAWPTGWPSATGIAAGPPPRTCARPPRAGLIAAIDRHDPDYANPFVAYAVACVVGEIKRYLRDTSWRLQVPRLLMEHSMQLYEAAGQLQQTLGRSPHHDRAGPASGGGRGGCAGGV